MTTDQIKLFALSSQLLEKDLDKIEETFGIDLRRDLASSEDDKDEAYYPQFQESIRREAAAMAAHYELFYCLEKSIRAMVSEKLVAEHGANWWTACVPPQVQQGAADNMQREIDSGVTLRSTQEIDYTTFGQLGEIVRKNASSFVDVFNSEKAFTKVMTSLNIIRGPIAHCSALAPDEVLRLQLTVRDWFRLME